MPIGQKGKERVTSQVKDDKKVIESKEEIRIFYGVRQMVSRYEKSN